jgi:signal transduction histidine kinase
VRRDLPAIELTTPLSLTLEEETLLDMHSVLNVCNVVLFELLNIEKIVGSTPELKEAQAAVTSVGRSLSDPEKARQAIENIESFTGTVESGVETTVSRVPGAASKAEVIESRANLESIFDILRVRAREISARSRDPDAWVEHDVEELRNNFLHVFRAIERNSKGGYRIVYNLAQHDEGDYYVSLQISSVRDSVIRMPAVFQDVMRDLIANARKYTDPGGRIEAALYEGERSLNLVVEDSGRGIPPEELTDLVAFGARGGNVGDRPTRGGGFGLTKAYYVTRKFGGRMWIAGEVNVGTRVEIRLPVPE